MRKLHLQAAFPRLCTLAEDFEDERGAVQHLGVPRLLQIALLHGRKLRIDDDDFRFERARLGTNLFHLARTDQSSRNRPREGHDVLPDDVQADSRRQTDGFGETRFGIAQLEAVARFALDMNDERARSFLFRNLKAGFAQAFSIAGAVSCSMSWIGPSGITVEMACL